MKKLIYILFALLFVLPAQSCKEVDENTVNKDFPATAEEIQGAWTCYRNGSYFDFVFDGGNYEMTVTNVFPGQSLNGRPPKDNTVDNEVGTFTMSGATINLSPTNIKETQFTSLEAYWSDSRKINLVLMPIGTFTRN